MSLLLLFQPQVVTPVLNPGAVFRDGMNTTANYDTVGSNTTFGGNTGMFGTLGACSSMRVTSSGTAYPYEGAIKTLPSAATVFQFYYRPATTATIGTGNAIFTVYQTSAFENASAPISINMRSNGTGFSLSLVAAQFGFATNQGATIYPLGVPIRILLAQDSTGWKLYVNNSTTAEITYTQTPTTLGYSYIAIGQRNQNAAGSYTGIADFDELWCGNMGAAPTTSAGRIADAYRGYLMNHLSADGQPYRSQPDGGNLTFAPGIDTVSESAVYMLKLCVQNNDQANFKLADNWILQNLLRSNSTTLNTQNNPAPTNALNMMAFHFNSAQTDGKGIGTIYDANWAGDADPERAQALLWAHSRFGSSANAVGIAAELIAPNYLQRALNVINDLRTYAFVNSAATGFNYLVNDSFQQGNATVQIGPDYNVPAAFKLFAQYDSANATFWANAVSGSYDVLSKAADVIFSGNTPAQTATAGLNPNWISFTVATAAVGTAPSTYGDNNYGFNAFRTYNRLYDIYNWYGDTAALAPLQKPKTFFTNQYAGTGIKATYNHDGTNAATYESNMFNYAAYWTLYAGDTANTTASGLQTTKLADTVTFKQAPFGSYYTTAPGSLQYSYFDQSWLITNYMQKNGSYLNYGQAAASVTLAANMPAAASMTAAINNTSTLASTMAASSATTGAISSSTAMASNMVASSSMTGAIVDKVPIASTQTASSTMTGAITNTDPMASTMTAAASQTGALAVITSLASNMVASSSMTAILINNEALAASMPASSSTTGAISVTEPMADTMVGGSSTTAALSNSTSLAAAMPASSTMTPSLGSTYAMAATMVGSAAMSGAISVTEPMAGSVPGTSSTTAAMTNTTSLAANMLASSSMVAADTAVEQLASTMAGSSTMTGAISVTKPVASTMAATSSSTGAISNTTNLASAMPASSSLAGSLSGNSVIPINASMPASSSMTANLLNATTLSAVNAATSSTTAVIAVSVPMAANMPGSSTMTGAIVKVVTLASVMTASSGMSGQEVDITAIASVMAAAASMNVTLVIVGPVQPKFGQFVRLTSNIRGVSLTELPLSAVSLTGKRSIVDSTNLTGKPIQAISLRSVNKDTAIVYL